MPSPNSLTITNDESLYDNDALLIAPNRDLGFCEAAGEVVENAGLYRRLRSIRGWRWMLSDLNSDKPVRLRGYEFITAAHAKLWLVTQSCRFDADRSFDPDWLIASSGHALGTAPVRDIYRAWKQYAPVGWWEAFEDIEVRRGMTEVYLDKFGTPRGREVLLATRRAYLFDRRLHKEKSAMTTLMHVRRQLRQQLRREHSSANG